MWGVCGLPPGTVVTVMCSVPGPVPAIDSTTTIPAGTASGTIYVPTKLPPSFNAILVITVLPPAGCLLNDSMIVNPRKLMDDPQAPALAAMAVAPAEAGIDDPSVTTPLLYLGDYVFVLVPDAS